MPRLGVLGTLVLDTIHGAGGSPEEGRPDAPSAPGGPVHALGGITYSLAAFEALPPRGWTQLPILKLGADAREAALPFLEGLETVDSLDGVMTVPEPNNRVELRYDRDGDRTERLSGGVPGWSWEELEPLARACDALYVNLIAGWELELPSARALGGAVGGPLYCDLHSMLLDHDPDGVRRPHVPPSWRSWVRCFDYVQLNEDELSLLADEEGRDPWTLARELWEEGPRVLFVTRGPAGATWLGGGGPSPGRGEEDVPAAVEGGDSTGCGDVWGVTCFGGLLEGLGPAEAVGRANRLASRNAALRGGTALLDDGGAGTAGDADGAGRGSGGAPR